MSEYGNNAEITGSLEVDGEIDLGTGDDNVDIDTGTLYVDAANDRVGIGTSSPSTSAILEISSSSKGVMLPRVLEASKPTATSALNGLMLYEEDTHRLKIVANGAWQTISYEG